MSSAGACPIIQDNTAYLNIIPTWIKAALDLLTFGEKVWRWIRNRRGRRPPHHRVEEGDSERGEGGGDRSATANLTEDLLSLLRTAPPTADIQVAVAAATAYAAAIRPASGTTTATDNPVAIAPAIDSAVGTALLTPRITSDAIRRRSLPPLPGTPLRRPPNYS